MPTVRIWTLEPDHDAKAIKRLANKLVTDLQLGNLSIQTADKEAFLKYNRGTDSLSDTLTMATQHCLQKDDCVIFVIDPGTPIPTHQRPQKSDSLIHHMGQIVDDDRFDGRVFLAQGDQELGLRLQTIADADRAARMTYAEAQLRQLCAYRGLDWDAMTEVEREDFVDTLIHEDRECSP